MTYERLLPRLGAAVFPSAEVERLFQPFQRLDPRRAVYKDGHGLGLSIVRAIASAHDASITAGPMPDGGLSVRVSFPSRSVSERSTQRNEYTTEKEFAALGPID